MNISSSQGWTALKKKALRSIKRILLDELDQDISNFDEKVEEIAKQVLKVGLSALVLEKAYFPSFDTTFLKMAEDQYLKEYLGSEFFCQNKEEDIPVEHQNSGCLRQNGEDPPLNIALLAEVFEILKSQADKYDENFTLILDISNNEELEKEALMLPIIQKHRESDFATLFNSFRPFLFDLLKRREEFKGFVEILRSLAKEEKIASQNIVNQLEVKDILLLLVESCSQASLPQLGLWFSYQYYPLPLIYLHGLNKYYCNLECCLEFLFQVRKPLITSIGTQSAIGVGKSSFLSYLFSLKAPAYFSTKNGFTHFGAVDLYVNLPSDQQNYIVADVQSFREDKEFMDMLAGVLIASQIILVHLTEKDISAQDGHINLNFEVNKRSKILYLWRDYDDDSHSHLLVTAKKSIEKSENELGVIGIPKLNGEQSFDIERNKSRAMQGIFQEIKALKLENCTPIVDLLKNLKQNEGLEIRMKEESKNIDFDQEVKEVENLLNEGIKQGSKKSFTESLLPCLFQDYRIIEETKKKKVLLKQHFEGMKEEDIQKQEENYKDILKIIEECKTQKKQIQPSSLIQKVVNVISSNDIYNILLLSEIINNWKMPKLEDVRKKYIALSALKEGNNFPDNQKNDLANEMDDKDLSLSTFLNEVLSYFESNEKAKSTPEYEEIKKYILSSMLQGAPLNLVNGKTLKFGNELFKEIFDKEIGDMKNIFVISIIGAQSSAKSTLLNVLFGCGFSTSAGRCTKGLYISLLHHQSGFNIIVIDTEGLLSVVGRDYEFDNLIATMAFSCSHIVIINNKGEINTKLRDLLEICVYAMKHLRLTSIKPKIIFALRDMLDQSDGTQQEMLLEMKSSLEQAANKLSININHIIDFSQKDIFLLPSAFQLSSGQNKTNIQMNNDLFSEGVLKMRQSMFKYLASIQDSAFPNLKFFYDQTEQHWNTISEHGSDIMRAKNLLEIELKDEALDLVNAICKTYSELLVQKGEERMEFYKGELRNYRLGPDSLGGFTLEMDAIFQGVKGSAIQALGDIILNQEKYKLLANNEKEFIEIVEYTLRWQKQRFESEWKVSVYSFEIKQEIKRVKSDISKKVNEKIQSLSPENLKDHTISYFHGLVFMLREEFDSNIKLLENNITKNLPREILAYFESAQKTANKKRKQDRVLIPRIDDIFDRIRGSGNHNYDAKHLYKPQFIWERRDTDKAIIEDQLKSFIGNLRLLIKDKPSEEIALKVIDDCLSRIQKMEKDKVSVNRSRFMNSALIEAMYYQYKKEFDVETKKTKEKQIEFQKMIIEEEQYVRDLLKSSSDSFGQGKRCANQWFREIKKVFCDEQEQLIQEALMKEIRQRFPAPETANQKAYKESFVAENYKNCLKYIFNINRFIQEIYEEEIQALTETKILKEIGAQVLNFIGLIEQTMAFVEEWSNAQDKANPPIELDTLISYIEKNSDLKRHFPDLYSIKLEDVDAFTRGCQYEFAILIQKDNVEKELKTTITQKTEEYLKAQYQDVTGCQARCPICGAKCNLASSPHNDHHTNCHLLAAFSGAHSALTNELILRSCFDPKQYGAPTYVGEKKFKNYDEMIDKEFPTWRQEFPRKDQRDKLEADVPAKVKKCWIAIKGVLTHYYGKKENTPKSWFDDAKDVRPLKPDIYLEGYMKKKSLDK